MCQKEKIAPGHCMLTSINTVEYQETISTNCEKPHLPVSKLSPILDIIKDDLPEATASWKPQSMNGYPINSDVLSKPSDFLPTGAIDRLPKNRN